MKFRMFFMGACSVFSMISCADTNVNRIVTDKEFTRWIHSREMREISEVISDGKQRTVIAENFDWDEVKKRKIQYELGNQKEIYSLLKNNKQKESKNLIDLLFRGLQELNAQGLVKGQELEKTLEKVKSLEEKLKNSDNKNLYFKEQLESERDKISKQQKTIDELLNEQEESKNLIDLLFRGLQELNAQGLVKGQELEKTLEKVKSLEEKLKNSDNKNLYLKEQLESEKDKISKQQKTIDELLVESGGKDRDLENLRSIIANLQNTIRELEQKNKNLETKKDEAEKRNANLEKQIQEMKEDKTKVEKGLQNEKDKGDTLNQQLGHQIQENLEKQEKIELLRQRIDTLLSEMIGLKGQLSNKEEIVRKNEQEIARIKDIYNKITLQKDAEIKALSDRIDVLSNKNKELEQQNTVLSDKNAELKHALQEQKNFSENVKIEILELQDQLFTQEEQSIELEKTITEQENIIENLKQDIDTVKNEKLDEYIVAQNDVEIRNLQEEVGKLKKENKTLQELLDKSTEDWEKIWLMREDWRKEISDQKEKIESLEEKVLLYKNQLSQKDGEIEEKVHSFNKELNKERNEIDNLRLKIEKLEKKYQEAQETIKDLEIQKKNADDQIRSQEKEIKKYRNMLIAVFNG